MEILTALSILIALYLLVRISIRPIITKKIETVNNFNLSFIILENILKKVEIYLILIFVVWIITITFILFPAGNRLFSYENKIHYLNILRNFEGILGSYFSTWTLITFIFLIISLPIVTYFKSRKRLKERIDEILNNNIKQAQKMKLNIDDPNVKTQILLGTFEQLKNEYIKRKKNPMISPFLNKKVHGYIGVITVAVNSFLLVITLITSISVYSNQATIWANKKSVQLESLIVQMTPKVLDEKMQKSRNNKLKDFDEKQTLKKTKQESMSDYTQQNLKPETVEVIQMLTRLYENIIFKYYSPKPSSFQSFNYNSSIVKNIVLQEAADQSVNSTETNYKDFKSRKGFYSSESYFIDNFSSTIQSTSSQHIKTKIGKKFEEDLVSYILDHPESSLNDEIFIEKINKEINKSILNMDLPNAVELELFNQINSILFSRFSVNDSTKLDDFFINIVDDVVSNQFEYFYENTWKTFVLGLEKNESILSLSQKMFNKPQKNIILTKNDFTALSDIYEDAVSRINFEKTQEIIDLQPTTLVSTKYSKIDIDFNDFLSNLKSSDNTKISDALSVFDKNIVSSDLEVSTKDWLYRFDDLFPHSFGSNTITPRGKLVSSNLTSIHSTGFDSSQLSFRKLAQSPNKLNASTNKILQSFISTRSYRSLSTSVKIGGVLIGLLPHDNIRLNYKDLTWDISGKMISFKIFNVETQNYETYREYPINIAYLALLYAADPRPVAATIVWPDENEPISDINPELKSIGLELLHPTLNDTNLGHNLIEMDRMMDTFTFGHTQESNDLLNIRATTHNRFITQELFYQFTAYLPLINNYKKEYNIDQMDAEFKKFVEQFEEMRDSISTEKVDINVLKTITNKTESPFSYYTNIYDQEIVQILFKAFKKSTNGDELLEHLDILTSTIDDERLNSILKNLTLSEGVISGIRENEYSLNTGLSFLNSESEDLFKFTVQPTYSLNEEVEIKTWNFPNVADELNDLVFEMIQKDSRSIEVIENVRMFIALQRFFRLGYDGWLGDDFPVDQYIILAREMRTNY